MNHFFLLKFSSEQSLLSAMKANKLSAKTKNLIYCHGSVASRKLSVLKAHRENKEVDKNVAL